MFTYSFRNPTNTQRTHFGFSHLIRQVSDSPLFPFSINIEC